MTAKTMPFEVKVGYRTLEIELMPKLSGYEFSGLVNVVEGKIEIRQELDGVEKLNTLIHEIIHAVDRIYRCEPPLTEPQVASLANGLHGVLRDNPELTRYIYEEASDAPSSVE